MRAFTLYPTEAVRAVLSMCQAVATWFRPEGPLTETEVARRYVTIAHDTLAFRRRGRGSAGVDRQ
jgi:hypothetical protein